MSPTAMALPADLDAELATTLLVDRHRLRRKVRELREAERAGRPFDQNLARWQAELARSQAEYARRAANRPQVTFDETLPIHAARREIAAAIVAHQVIVVAGETGSGKSTQLPKICLELGRGVAGLIGHTQPRRIAARTIAGRIAEELGVPLGREVGYQVRFTDVTSPQTAIKLLTDGLLLAETQGDRWLNRYDTLIIDEAHERSLNIDFLLGYLHRLLPKRPELKLLITSATIDAERFAAHFRNVAGEVPVFEVSGRMYPVETIYAPPQMDSDGYEEEPAATLARAVEDVCHRGPGDVLIFLPTERDIHDAMKTLRGRSLAGGKPQLLPLYARLSVQEQQRVFTTAAERRIILATNVAESSLTVPGIRYVIDTGTARLSRYSPRSKLQRLPIEPISQASADQRAGRCGRVGPGVCLRLYAEDDYRQRERYTAPEVLRSNLASVILQLEALGLGTVDEFPFLDPPKPEAIRDGYKTLFEIGAVDAEQRLTPLGKALHRLPVDPRIGRIVLAAEHEHCLGDVLIIASAIEAQDPRERPLEKQQMADEAHSRFADADSDFVSLLRLWDFYHRLKDDLTRSQLRKACQQNFLSFLRMKEWIDVHRELVELVDRTHSERRRSPGRERSEADSKRERLPDGPLEATRYGAIHRALLTGFLSGVALRTETGEYQAAGGMKAALWPGSGLAGKSSKWIVAAELVETSRRFLRVAARIDPAWIEPLAEHLITRTHSEPHWDADQLAAMAFERVTLFGLPVVPRRRVRYGRIDPVASRQLLLRQGLVLGEWTDPPEFLQQNLALARHVADLQARARQPAPLRDEDELIDFYETRIPKDITDGRGLLHWSKQHATALRMTEADVLVPDAALSSVEQFPEQLVCGELELPLTYKHEPGHADDGVTVTVPQSGLNQLDADRLGWLVPGLLEEKVTALLKTLPKDYRRHLAPIPQTARQVVARLPLVNGSLVTAIAQAVQSVCGVTIAPSEFQEANVPEHLRLRIDVVAADGRSLGTSRDLVELRQQLGADAAAIFAAGNDPQWTRDGLKAWDFGDLPESVPIQRQGLTLTGYPTLFDRDDSVSLRLLDSAVQAAYELRFGVRRLCVLTAAREIKPHVEHIPALNAWTLLTQTLPQPLPLRQQLTDLIADRAYLGDRPLPRTQGDFGVTLAAGKRELAAATTDVIRQLTPLFEAYTQVRRSWERLGPPQYRRTRDDLHDQLAQLFVPGFLVRTPWPWLAQLPRYLRGIVRRIEKLSTGGAPRDAALIDGLSPLWQRWKDRSRQHADRNLYDPELITYRWMLEEYRILLFAQDLGTAVSVSEKRLDKQWVLVAT